MKKNSPLYDDEIDLIAVFKIIWDGKIKILLITIISFFVGFEYNSQIPVNYLNSLTIKPSNNIEFIELDNIDKLLKTNQSNQSKLVRFIKELEDYEEFLPIIKNTKKTQEHLSKLKIEDQENELFKYAKLLEIVKPKKGEDNYIINFKWHDPEESKKILQNTLNLTSKSLNERIVSELDKALKFDKKLSVNKDKIRLDYLKEQSAIAKEIDIKDNQIDYVSLTQSSVSLNINTADTAYYLRGYKAIDKEIELIENRDYQKFKFIEQELNSFEAQNIKFVDYNVFLMEHNSLKDTKLILIISILLGLIAGIFYVIISNAFNQKSI